MTVVTTQFASQYFYWSISAEANVQSAMIIPKPLLNESFASAHSQSYNSNINDPKNSESLELHPLGSDYQGDEKKSRHLTYPQHLDHLIAGDPYDFQR